MAIKDLRKKDSLSEKLLMVEKEAYVKAYKEILEENVVLKEEEFKNLIKEAQEKAIEELKKSSYVLDEAKLEEVEEEMTKEILSTVAETLGVDLEKLAEALEENIELKAYDKEGLKEAVLSGNIEGIIAIPEEKEKEFEEKFIEKLKNGEVEGIYVIEESQIPVIETQMEEKILEKFKAKMSEAIGEDSTKEIIEAIEEAEKLYVLKESELELVEAKMKEKLGIKESKIGQEELRQILLNDETLYNMIQQEIQNADDLKQAVCENIKDVDCENIDWATLLTDVMDESSKEENKGSSLFEKLVDDKKTNIQESNQDKGLLDKLI